MKKLLYAGLFSLLAMAPIACTTEVDEVFDVPASDRVEQRMAECKQLLTSAQYGWLIRYYPSENQYYGGSSYAAKFESNGDVTVTGEVAQELTGDVAQTITSHYSINSSSSVLLTFDTYNDYIHYWSDPDYFSTNAYDGDFEFAYVSGNEQEMIFRGIKTGNRIVFTALEEDIVSSVQRIVDIQNDVNDQLYMGYTWNDGTLTEDATAPELYDDDSSNIMIYYPTGDKDGEYVEIPYAFTSDGIAFYQAQTINGVTVSQFKWEDGAFVSTDAVASSGAPTEVKLSGFHCDNFIHYDKFLGDYTLTYYNGAKTYTVKLAEKEHLKSYTMTGISYNSVPFEFELDYSKADCSLSLNAQYIGRYGSYYAWACMWDANAGYLTWSSSIGMILQHNGDADHLELTFEDNGKWGAYTVNSILIRAFSTQAASSSTSKGNVLQIPYLNSLTKL